MANRYTNLVGSKKISEDFNNINIGFDRVQDDMDKKAAAASPALTGTPTAPTQPANDNSTKIATTQYADRAAKTVQTNLDTHVNDKIVHVTQADHDKLGGIAEGAEVNQNAFAKVNDIEAADPSSQFYIVGGIGITVTSNQNNGEITVTATGDAAPGAHGSTHTEHGADPIPTATATEGGIMSAAQAAELITHGELLQEQGAAITDLENRLDTADTSQLTLQPGLQVVSAVKDARFNLGSIKGKSEINPNGRIGIVGIENPYVIRYGENLLPPFYEWVRNHFANTIVRINKPYEMTIVASDVDQQLYVSIDVLPHTNYYVSLEQGNFSVLDDAVATTLVPWGTGSSAFNTGNYTRIRVYVSGVTAGTFFFRNPMLTLGSEPKPFKPREDSMLAFQTELHANPTDGSESDELFEMGGEYRKLKKWQKVAVGDQRLSYGVFETFSNRKSILIPYASLYGVLSSIAVLTKFNGTLMTRSNSPGGLPENNFYIDGDSNGGNIVISISNVDSGWGQEYPPTQDEIKAYFDGWTMYDGNTPSPNDGLYNDATGQTKWWARRVDGVNRGWIDGRNVLPTTQAPNWTPYNLLYRLAKEVVEPAVSEGCLTLNEGDNVVEVGAGIVLRERANPISYGTVSNINDQSSKLSKATNRILQVYRDSEPDLRWSLLANSSSGYGGAVAQFAGSYDQSAAYSVTYLKLDKSPIVPISGVVASNEKAQLSDLTAGVAEALHGVSVLAMDKAEKNAPPPQWITPTLLNGWVVYGGYPTLSIRKDSNNLYFDGLIKGGVYSPGTTIAHLPDGYSPRVTKVVSVPCLTGEGMYSIAHLFIRSDGTIAIFSAPGNEYLSFAELSIPLN